jgi:hypothetical protein
MSVEQDYVMRMIKDMAKLIAKMVLGKTSINYELPEENKFTKTDFLYEKLMRLADEGKINEAENLLSEELDYTDINQYELAMSFYLYINEFDNDFLESNDYSREEIKDGIKTVSEKFGLSTLVDQLLI